MAIKTPIDDKITNSQFQEWPLDLLIDYIVKKHHSYVEEKTLLIRGYLTQLVEVHGEKHPELLQIHDLFHQASGELAAHMKKEEIILFPFINQLIDKAKLKDNSPFRSSIKSPIAMMRHEHTAEENYFIEIARLTNDYTPPSDGCSTYYKCYELLKEFEADLHQHIHLENDLLFQKAIQLEQSITA